MAGKTVSQEHYIHLCGLADAAADKVRAFRDAITVDGWGNDAVLAELAGLNDACDASHEAARDWLRFMIAGGEVECCGHTYETRMRWAQEQLDRVTPTTEAVRAFDNSPQGSLYLRITGMTMWDNLGGDTLPDTTDGQ